MEKRTITQIGFYLLKLNSIYAKAEDSTPVAYSFDKQSIIDWHNNMLAPWIDTQIVHTDTWEGVGAGREEKTLHKSFPKDSRLENYNHMPMVDGSIDRHGAGIHFLWIDESDLEDTKASMLHYQVEFIPENQSDADERSVATSAQ